MPTTSKLITVLQSVYMLLGPPDCPPRISSKSAPGSKLEHRTTDPGGAFAFPSVKDAAGMSTIRPGRSTWGLWGIFAPSEAMVV
jgi:hypothetical protein